MNYDPYCLEERIISDLTGVFKKDPILEEFDIIPATESKNRSPVIHVSHNIGIEVWCVKSVFMYCYENFFKLQGFWKKEHYRLERYSRTALILNANISTLWNYRKKLITNNLLDHQVDFLLTKLVLSQKPKSVEALSHRRWLLKHSNLNSPSWIENELKLCSQLANRMKCNYHAWSHRQWTFLHSNCLEESRFQLWLSEFRASEEWTRFHLSDFSGWHYRQFLLEQLLKHIDNMGDRLGSFLYLLCSEKTSAIKSPLQFYNCLLKEELVRNQDLILNFSAHETLWYFRRFVLRGLLDSWNDEESFMQSCRSSPNADSNQERYLENHRRWLSHCV